MGYELYITKKACWFEDGPVISLQEWQYYVANDPDIRMDNFAEAENTSGEVIRIECPGIAIWEKWSKNGVDGCYAWMNYNESSGTISVSHPDQEIIGKMWEIAQHFSAIVQGEECEIYDRDGTGREML
ncbi:MAG: hypothetical protein JXR97_04340 [Planctomycetes bacterium]|nr:hypothetical protein [Planctomycetota bacterium]